MGNDETGYVYVVGGQGFDYDVVDGELVKTPNKYKACEGEDVG